VANPYSANWKTKNAENADLVGELKLCLKNQMPQKSNNKDLLLIMNSCSQDRAFEL